MIARDIFPWPPEVRERVRQELRWHPLRVLMIPPKLAMSAELSTAILAEQIRSAAREDYLLLPAGTEIEIIEPRPRRTVLGEERKARWAQAFKLCRKCQGRGTKRHHAMCMRRGGGPQRWRAKVRRQLKDFVGRGLLPDLDATSRRILERTSIATASGPDLEALAALSGIERSYTTCSPPCCDVSMERKAPAARLGVVEVEGVELPVREVVKGEPSEPCEAEFTAPDGGRFVVGVDPGRGESSTVVYPGVYINGKLVGMAEHTSIEFTSQQNHDLELLKVPTGTFTAVGTMKLEDDDPLWALMKDDEEQ